PGTKEEKQDLAQRMVDGTGATAVGMIGHVITLYREQPDPEKRRIEIPGGGGGDGGPFVKEVAHDPYAGGCHRRARASSVARAHSSRGGTPGVGDDPGERAHGSSRGGGGAHGR